MSSREKKKDCGGGVRDSFWADDEQTGSYSGTYVGFEELGDLRRYKNLTDGSLRFHN
jgi:hypothetical protein